MLIKTIGTPGLLLFLGLFLSACQSLTFPGQCEAAGLEKGSAAFNDCVANKEATLTYHNPPRRGR
ncbi:MAG: hypothetical protein AAF530_13470 [Pseudomonadota bacterium]